MQSLIEKGGFFSAGGQCLYPFTARLTETDVLLAKQKQTIEP